MGKFSSPPLPSPHRLLVRWLWGLWFWLEFKAAKVSVDVSRFSPCVINLTRNKNIWNAARWLVDLLGHEQICCASSCEFDEKRAKKPKYVAQSRPALYFSHKKFFCCATSCSRKVKNGKNRRKLATKHCISYFAALSIRTYNDHSKLNPT